MNYHVSFVRRLSVLDQRPKTVRSMVTHIRWLRHERRYLHRKSIGCQPCDAIGTAGRIQIWIRRIFMWQPASAKCLRFSGSEFYLQQTNAITRSQPFHRIQLQTLWSSCSLVEFISINYRLIIRVKCIQPSIQANRHCLFEWQCHRCFAFASAPIVWD